MKGESNAAAGLPVAEAWPALRTALAAGARALLVAPPGAGKSTWIPLRLLEEPWAAGRKILLLEPRRVAARAVAARMAASLSEPVGATVGWRMRLDTRVGARTRLEVVTEGVLTRMLQQDPALEVPAAAEQPRSPDRPDADTGIGAIEQLIAARIAGAPGSAGAAVDSIAVTPAVARAVAAARWTE